MIKKISRKTFLTSYPNFYHGNARTEEYIVPDTYNNYILYVDALSTNGLCNQISKELTQLLKLLKYEKIFFLGDTNIPWLFRDHDYKPVKKGLTYLINNKISKSFNGAIEVGIADLTEFMTHLFWLVRCNGIITNVHFSDTGFNIMGSICQYGNIHISTLNKETDIAFNAIINNTKLSFLADNNCGGGRISGRKGTFL